MIQFNLLPDVKLEFIRARRMKRTVIMVSATIAASSLVLLVLLFLAVSVFQKKHLNDLSRDITTVSQKLQNTEDLNKVLTVQNQLNSLSGLYDQAPVTSRLFGYLQQITPNAAGISDLNLDFTTNILTIKGTSDSLETVNKFVDTVKFTTYKAADDTQTKAFKSVVLSNFSRTQEQSTYEIAIGFDPVIFDNATTITSLTVPTNFITTRSQTESPNELFQSSPNGGGN